MTNIHSISVNAGLNLRSLRERAGITQEELGYETGFCDRQIRRYETEGIETLGTALRFANYFQVDAKEFLFGNV